MATLLDTVNDMVAVQVKKPTRISLEKTKKELMINATKASPYFRKMKIDVARIPLLSAGREDGPLIVDVNYDNVRRTKSGFLSKLIVVSGLNKLKAAKDSKILHCNAWVGDKVNEKFVMKADDAISSNDLDSKLRDLIAKTYTKPAKSTQPYESGTYAYIVDIYPFEGYCIFRMKDNKYRQKYKLDVASRTVELDGKPTQVFEQYVDVPITKTGITSDASEVQESLLDRPNVAAPALGGVNGPSNDWSQGADYLTHFGAPGSEANNPMLKLMLNVEDALAQYNHETSIGVHKVVYLPYAQMPPGLINAGREAKIAANLAGMDVQKFSAMDFLRWQDKKMRIKAQERRKFVNGKTFQASSFAYVGDEADISTWQMPVYSRKSALQSLADLKACSFIPQEDKKEVREVIFAAAKCTVCGKAPCVCPDGGTKGGPHLGKGKSASKAIKELDGKKNKK